MDTSVKGTKVPENRIYFLYLLPVGALFPVGRSWSFIIQGFGCGAGAGGRVMPLPTVLRFSPGVGRCTRYQRDMALDLFFDLHSDLYIDLGSLHERK